AALGCRGGSRRTVGRTRGRRRVGARDRRPPGRRKPLRPVGPHPVRAVLDTSVLVAEHLRHPGYEVVVSSLSWAELGYGVRKAADPVERARREARVSRLRAVLG